MTFLIQIHVVKLTNKDLELEHTPLPLSRNNDRPLTPHSPITLTAPCIEI